MKIDNLDEEIIFQGINHITFAVENLERSIRFYEIIFGVEPLAKGEKLAYFQIGDVWFALNVESKLKSDERQKTYTHIAFSMTESSQKILMKKLDHHCIGYELGRSRNEREGHSVYIRDYDGHLIELHDLTLKDRLKYYSEMRKDIEDRKSVV